LAGASGIRIIVTEKNTKKYMEPGSLIERNESGHEIRIDIRSPAQRILGFGGAFTQSASAVLESLSPKLREHALRAYFHPEDGIAYNMGRTHIGCCDFCMEPYTLNDTPGDTEMTRFDISHDERWLIPFIKNAASICEQRLLLYAVPWSPPAWMKTNGMLSDGGELKPEYYKAMGRYLVQFVKTYSDHGVDIWALGIQNEPDEVQRWASCRYSAGQEKAFLFKGLLPTLDASGLKDIQILLWDSNKDRILAGTRELLSDPLLVRRGCGVAFHWYSGDYFENLYAIRKEFPDILLISTESCTALLEDVTDWGIGERYAHEIIGDMNSGANAFIDWNLFLDKQGGPNMHGNFCTAPVMADTENDRLIYLNSYYYIGHFSKFIRRGAVRLGIMSDGNILEACSFQNPDGSVVAVVLNTLDIPQKTTLCMNSRRARLYLREHSIQTVIFDAENGSETKSTGSKFLPCPQGLLPGRWSGRRALFQPLLFHRVCCPQARNRDR
jgi:glucosylceramidase